MSLTQMLLIAATLPNPDNPRTTVDPEADGHLTESIRRHGVLQPIGVRRQGDVFQVVWGDRRRRCAAAAGLTHVPGVVLDREMGELDYWMLTWTENEARESLTGPEVAEFIERLAHADPALTNGQIADKLGKDGSSVTRYRGVRAASPEVWQAFKGGRITLAAGYDLSRLAEADQPAALEKHLGKPKPRRGRKPKGDDSGPKVRRLTLMTGDATVVVTGRQIDLPKLIDLLRTLMAEVKSAREQHLDATTFERVLADRARGAAVAGA